MRIASVCFLLFLVAAPAGAAPPTLLETQLSERAFLVDQDWNAASLEDRRAFLSEAYVGLDDASHWDLWIHIHSFERKLAQFDGRMIVLYADPQNSDIDRDLVMESNSPGALDQDARIAFMPAVSYPDAARDTEIEGTAGVRCRVDANGRVDLVLVMPGDGDGLLIGAAVDAMREARFEPAKTGGNIAGSWVLVPFEFVLKGEVAIR